MEKRRPRVLFIRHTMKHYRQAFYEGLYRRLMDDGIELHVVYGRTNREHRLMNDDVELPPEYGRKVKAYWVGDRLVYHSAWHEIREADLVIVAHENKALLTWMLLPLARLGAKKVAFWDFDWYRGKEVKVSLLQPGDWLRYRTRNLANWWFAYTQECAEDLRRSGVTCGITAVENAVDTREIRRLCSGINDDEVKAAKAGRGIGAGPIGIYCGTLSGPKRVEFLVSAARRIRAKLPEFELLIMGTGQLRSWVEQVAKEEPFVHYLGPLHGHESALAFRMADLFLLPGKVGLAVLDSFAAGLPLITTDLPYHAPEVCYLKPGINGMITGNSEEDYANAVVGLLRDPDRLAQLRQAAMQTGKQYTMENMVENFRNGIMQCLSLNR